MNADPKPWPPQPGTPWPDPDPQPDGGWPRPSTWPMWLPAICLVAIPIVGIVGGLILTAVAP